MKGYIPASIGVRLATEEGVKHKLKNSACVVSHG